MTDEASTLRGKIVVVSDVNNVALVHVYDCKEYAKRFVKASKASAKAAVGRQPPPVAHRDEDLPSPTHSHSIASSPPVASSPSIASSPPVPLLDDLAAYEIADDEEEYVDAQGRRLYRITTPPIRLAHRRPMPSPVPVPRPVAPAVAAPVQTQLARPVARGLNLTQQLLLDARKPRVLSRSDIHPPNHPSRTLEVAGIRRQPPQMSTAAFYQALGAPPSARALAPTHPAIRPPPPAMQVGYAPLPAPHAAARRSTIQPDTDALFFTTPSVNYNRVRFARDGVAGPSNEIFRQEDGRVQGQTSRR